MTTGPCSRRGSPSHPATPSGPREHKDWRYGLGRRMLRPDAPGVRKPVPTAKVLRAACLALGLALLGAGCFTPEREAIGNGVRGGTLRVLTHESLKGLTGLDTAGYPTVARAYARTLYSYNLAGPPEEKTIPVPDIASGPPQITDDRRTYTFQLRAGVRYAP